MEFKLKDLVNIKYGKNQKNVKNPRGEYPILGTGGIMDYADDFLYDKPSVLIGRKGSIGKVKYIEEPFWTIDTLFYTIVNENLVIPKYLYYKLSQIDFNYYNEGTTIPSLRTETLYKIDIDLPKKNIQKKVVNLLNTIDKKIENNQKIITNLEELSQTLFKRWFVDFEFPDENGNPYKSSGGEMDESELGEIPKGWIVNNINDFANNNVITGKTPSTKVKENYSETGIPFLTIPDMHKDVFALNTERYISETGIEKLEKKILEKNSLAISCIATPGLVSIISNDTLTNQQINSFTPNKTELYYLYFYLKGMRNYIRDLGSGGSATLNLNKTQFEKIKLVKPINELLLKYDKLVHSNFEIILNFQKENNYLIQLRDTLLPKLMSGEIEIPDDIEVNKDELSI